MPKIKRLTKAEKKCRKKQRAVDYYTKNREEVNKRAMQGMRRFRARSKRREASAERHVEIEATELAERKNAACFKSRALAQWPRKTTPSKLGDDHLNSASSTGKPDGDDQGGNNSAARFASDWKQGRPISLPDANIFRIQCYATTTTRPFPFLSAENDINSLPPSSPPSYSDEELYDSDNSIPIAPYD